MLSIKPTQHYHRLIYRLLGKTEMGNWTSIIYIQCICMSSFQIYTYYFNIFYFERLKLGNINYMLYCQYLPKELVKKIHILLLISSNFVPEDQCMYSGTSLVFADWRLLMNRSKLTVQMTITVMIGKTYHCRTWINLSSEIKLIPHDTRTSVINLEVSEYLCLKSLSLF